MFAGGCTLEAAEAVVDPEGQPAVLEASCALVEQSLLRQSAGTDGEPRYRMLEIVREFGLEQLAALEREIDGAGSGMRATFLVLPRTIPMAFMSSVSLDWLPRVAFERDNVRLALGLVR